jgi:CRP/FNR family transcriptional regulator
MMLLEPAPGPSAGSCATAENSPVGTARSGASRLDGECASCRLQAVCLPCNLVPVHRGFKDVPAIRHRKIKRGEHLFRSGDACADLIALRSGWIKTVQQLENDREQIVGFHMAGDLVGIDGLAGLRHHSDAIALEDSRACAISLASLQQVESSSYGAARSLQVALSAQIVIKNSLILWLGTMDAERRVANFLLQLSERLGKGGYSPTRFVLRMTRSDIGSYLGLRIETVSRVFSRLREVGLIAIEGRNILILDLAALRSHADGTDDPDVAQMRAGRLQRPSRGAAAPLSAVADRASTVQGAPGTSIAPLRAVSKRATAPA